MTVWFTSDTHFSSQRTLEISHRPFRSVTEMDNTIFSYWIGLFKPGDVLYHLGDFGEFERALGWLEFKQMTCHLVLGNYEERAIEEGKLSVQKLLDMGFASVSKQLYIPEILGAKAVHHPRDCDKKHFNVFGHIHGLQTVKRYGIDVGVDAHHFRPISAEEVLEYKNAIETIFDDNVFE